MRAKQFTEAALGTTPKRPPRDGSRPERGHKTEPRYAPIKSPKHYDPDWISKLSNDQLDAIAGPRYPKKTVDESNKVATPKPRNFVAKNAIQTGAGAHKDKKKAAKQGDTKHKAKSIPVDEAMAQLEDAFNEGKASRELCKSSKPDEDLGASNLASCKSQGLRARDGNKSHKMGKSPESRMVMGGHKVKGKKYGGKIPDWGTRKGQV